MQIEVYHEHLCTRALDRFLNTEIAKCKPNPGFPRILLSTPSDEHHELGLLMAEAVLADHGAHCVALGAHTPLKDLRMASEACRAEVIALSFSFAYPARRVRPILVNLRHLLPAPIEIWAGGSGASFIKRPPKGVRIFSNLQESVTALQNLVSLKRRN